MNEDDVWGQWDNLKKDWINELIETGIVVTKTDKDGKMEVIKAGTKEWFDAIEKSKSLPPSNEIS